LLKFKAQQQVVEIGNARIGGQPGTLPTVLIGNIFYEGMPEVTDHKAGVFDQKSVLKWIQTADELSAKTGTPHFVDVMAMYPRAMRQYVKFVSEHTESVFLIDGSNPETRIAGMKTAHELGLQRRAILNSISPQVSESEIEAIRESGITSAIFLAYNELDFSPAGRVSIMKGSEERAGLLSIAERARIDKILVDTVVFDVPSIAYATEAVKLVKNELGYPSGCSPANATYDWRRQQHNLLRDGFAAYNAAAHTIVQFGGADFLIYGPLKQARSLIPTCAMNDAIIAYYTRKELGTKPSASDHPLYKIF